MKKNYILSPLIFYKVWEMILILFYVFCGHVTVHIDEFNKGKEATRGE